MHKKLQKFGVGLLLSLATSLASAVFIDRGTFTSDTATGLDWLDLSQTNELSTNYITQQLGVGGALYGWRFANGSEVSGLFANAGDPGPYGFGADHDQAARSRAVNTLLPLLGSTFEVPGVYRYASVHFEGSVAPELAGFYIGNWMPDAAYDVIQLSEVRFATGDAEAHKAHALVRATISTVPEPSMLSLTCFGLVMVFGIAVRHRLVSTTSN